MEPPPPALEGEELNTGPPGWSLTYKNFLRPGGTDIAVRLLSYQVGVFLPSVTGIFNGLFTRKVGSIKASHKRYILSLNAFFGSKYLNVSSLAINSIRM